MKIRNGFVSNSSSSNFIMRVPEGSTAEYIREKVGKHVGTMEGFFIPDFREQLINIIIKCKGSKNDCISDLKWELKWLEEDPDRDTKQRDYYQSKCDDEFDHYQGGFSDNGDGPIQLWLCNSEFKIEDEDGFFMENHCGY